MNISIIVTLYNKVNEVCRALDSIFAQTIQDFELIIVDGGSTDGSLEVIKKYENDPRYHLIHQKSKGLPAGRIEGILAASNTMIAFLDADDEWLPTFLEQILELRSMYPEAGLYATSYISVYQNSYRTTPACGIPKKPWKGVIKSYFQTTVNTMQPPFCPSCVAIPKETFNIVGYFNPETRIGEDTEFWGRIAMSLPIVYSTIEGAKYYWFADNKMTDNRQPIDHHPFYKYIFSQPNQETLLNSIEGLRLYLELEELNMAYINLIAGQKEYVRRNLEFVKSRRFLKRKILFTICLCLPTKIISYMPVIKMMTLDKIRCYISSLKE